jgi:H+-transporting ATPase
VSRTCKDIADVDLILNKIRWLDHVGRTQRSKKNEKLENFLTDLQRLTIVHETDHTGSYYRFASGGAQTPAQQDNDKKGQAKDTKTKNKADDAKDGKDKKGGGPAEGDKKLEEDHKGEEEKGNQPDVDAQPKTEQEEGDQASSHTHVDEKN